MKKNKKELGKGWTQITAQCSQEYTGKWKSLCQRKLTLLEMSRIYCSNGHDTSDDKTIQ
jgi:hypothetical protein